MLIPAVAHNAYSVTSSSGAAGVRVKAWAHAPSADAAIVPASACAGLQIAVSTASLDDGAVTTAFGLSVTGATKNVLAVTLGELTGALKVTVNAVWTSTFVAPDSTLVVTLLSLSSRFSAPDVHAPQVNARSISIERIELLLMDAPIICRRVEAMYGTRLQFINRKEKSAYSAGGASYFSTAYAPSGFSPFSAIACKAFLRPPGSATPHVVYDGGTFPMRARIFATQPRQLWPKK